MGQWGAYGLARHHWTYDQILGHYYSGTGLGMVGSTTVRVLLQARRSSISFDGATSASGKRLDPRAVYRARSASRGIALYRGKHRAGTFAAPLRVSSSRGVLRLLGTALNGISGGRYRGTLEIRSGSGLMAVNALALDDYVRGVISAEEPSSWPIEGLKAQAVAARSYALTTDRGRAAFDQYPDTRSQVYRGVAGETRATDAAVKATKRQVVTYRGRIATTYFFSSSGGHTENIENVWPGSNREAYLRGVDDPYDGSALRHSWTLTFTRSQMQSRLRGLVKGTFQGIHVVKRGVSPRILWADVIGSRGKTRVRGGTLRARLGLFDTWASFSSSTARKASSSAPRQAVTGGTPMVPQTRPAAPQPAVVPLPEPQPRLPSWRWPASTWRARAGSG
jgi:stage II sporulation protein D